MTDPPRLLAEIAKLQRRVAELEAALREISKTAGAKVARDRRRKYADPDEIAGRLGADAVKAAVVALGAKVG